jgi:hypothetical protein
VKIVRLDSEEKLPLVPAWHEARAVIRFEPIESGVHLRIQTDRRATLDERSALFGVFHRAAGFHFIGPLFDFCRRLGRAVGQQPSTDFLIVRRGLNSDSKLLASDALKVEKHIVQRTIVTVLAHRSRQAGSAFIDGTAGDRESGEAVARAERRLFGQVSGDYRSAHNSVTVLRWFLFGDLLVWRGQSAPPTGAIWCAGLCSTALLVKFTNIEDFS